jgi:hypothetical protein
MKTFSLSTCLTVVLMLLNSPEMSFAEIKLVGGDRDCSKRTDAAARKRCNEDEDAKAEQERQLRELDINLKKRQFELGECKPAMEAYNKAVNDFKSSCSSAEPILKELTSVIGMPKFTDFPTYCTALVNQCRKCAGLAECDSESSLLDDDEDDEPSANPNTIGAGGSRKDTQRYKESLTKGLKMCRPPTGDDYTAARDRVREYKKDRAKLEEKARDAQLDITKVAQSQTEAKNKLDDQAEAMQLRMEEKQRALKAAARDRENKIKEVILKIEADVKGLEINMERLKLQQVEADITLAEALTQLDNQCHAQALVKVEEHRKQVLKAIETSSYTPGGQSNLFSGVGKSMRQKFKKLAADYFKECKDSELTKNLKQAARNRKSLADSRAQAEITGMQDAIKRLQAQAKELQTTERQAAMQEQLEALQALQKEANANYTKLERRRGEVGSEAGMKMMEASQKLSFAQAELAREAGDIEEDQALVSIGRRFSLGRSGDKGSDIAKASEDYEAVYHAASPAAYACCMPKEGSTATGPDTQNCKSACKFLDPAKARENKCPESSIVNRGHVGSEGAK